MNKYCLIILLTSIFSSLIGHSSPEKRVFVSNFNNKKQFVEVKKDSSGYWINSSCQQCDAIKIISNINKIKNIDDHENFIVNPSTIKCEVLGGRAIILEDLKLNQYDFCRFQDKSIIFLHTNKI